MRQTGSAQLYAQLSKQIRAGTGGGRSLRTDSATLFGSPETGNQSGAGTAGANRTAEPEPEPEPEETVQLVQQVLLKVNGLDLGLVVRPGEIATRYHIASVHTTSRGSHFVTTIPFGLKYLWCGQEPAPTAAGDGGVQRISGLVNSFRLYLRVCVIS